MAITKLKGAQIFDGTITAADIDDALEKEFTKVRTTTDDSTPNFLSSKITAGTNVTLNVRGSVSTNQTLEISASNLAPINSPFLTIGNDATLTGERAFTAGTGLTGVDGGTNSTYTLGINNTIVATVSGTTFTGATLHSSGLSGSLTQLTNGTSYLIAGSNVTVTTGSSGAVTISAPNLASTSEAFLTLGNTAGLSAERAFTAGIGLTATDGGANSTYTLGINNSVVATVSGTTFTGATRHNSGLSGSLTQLTNGTSYLIAGSNTTIVTGSSGAVTITSIPSSPTNSVQYNNAGSFGGSSSFTFDGTKLDLQVGFAQGSGVTTTGQGSHAQGLDASALGSYSHAEGFETIARGVQSHAEGNTGVVAIADYSHAEGILTIASGTSSHAEGYSTVTSGSASHAEGRLTIARGDSSHAEGYGTVSIGLYSHAEGNRCNAIGDYSHAGGNNTDTVGQYSTTAGSNTVASGSSQVVFGKYNKQNNTDSLFIVGNGGNATTGRNDILLVNTGSVLVGSASLSPITFFFVSGTIAAGTDSRLTIFGGDTVVSGNLKVEQITYTDTVQAWGPGGVTVNGNPATKTWDLQTDTALINTKIYSDTVLTLSGTTGNKVQAKGPMYGLLGSSTSAYGRMPLVVTSSYSNSNPASAGVATTVARPTVPASTLETTGDRVRCTLEFTAAANANNKQIILQYGLTSSGSGTQFLSYTTTNNGGVTILNFSIVRTGASTQIFRGTVQDTTTAASVVSPINGSTSISNTSDCDLYIRLNNTTTAAGMVLTAYSLVYESNS